MSSVGGGGKSCEGPIDTDGGMTRDCTADGCACNCSTMFIGKCGSVCDVIGLLIVCATGGDAKVDIVMAVAPCDVIPPPLRLLGATWKSDRDEPFAEGCCGATIATADGRGRFGGGGDPCPDDIPGEKGAASDVMLSGVAGGTLPGPFMESRRRRLLERDWNVYKYRGT